MAKKPKIGRPTRYNAQTREKIMLLARRGFIDTEMALIIGVTDKTLDNWKLKHPDFFRSIHDWKLKADSEVERSLFERATGYEHPETKAQFVDGKWETLNMIKHYPPDTQAARTWLFNRRPGEWRDRRELHVTDKTVRVNKKRFDGEMDEGE